MSNQQAAIGSRSSKSKSSRSAKHKLVRKVAIILAVLALTTIGYLVFSKLTVNTNNSNVLTISDLDDPNVVLDPDTSDASVNSLKKDLKAKINKQIDAKENPIDTVKIFAGVLSNTTNNDRKDQLSEFLKDFLENHENSLWFKYNSDIPDQAQVNYWKGELYVTLVYNLQQLTDNKYKGDDGKIVDTYKDQIKYIDLYLTLANDPKSHITVSEENKDNITDYEYRAVSDLLRIKNELNGGRRDG